MANAEVYQGGERSFAETAAWYGAALGFTVMALGMVGGYPDLIALGFAVGVGGLILGSMAGKSK